MLKFTKLQKTGIHTVFIPIELQTDIMHQLTVNRIEYAGKRWNKYNPDHYKEELETAKTFYSEHGFGNRYCLLRVPFRPADFYQHTRQFFGNTEDPALAIRKRDAAKTTMRYYETHLASNQKGTQA